MTIMPVIMIGMIGIMPISASIGIGMIITIVCR
jgi:hypothetical protein